jgi:hypothetical protein
MATIPMKAEHSVPPPVFSLDGLFMAMSGHRQPLPRADNRRNPPNKPHQTRAASGSARVHLQVLRTTGLLIQCTSRHGTVNTRLLWVRFGWPRQYQTPSGSSIINVCWSVGECLSIRQWKAFAITAHARIRDGMVAACDLAICAPCRPVQPPCRQPGNRPS